MKKSKYNNQNPMEIPKNKKELNNAIVAWAEGNYHLERLLWKCIEKNVKTEACCGGHENSKKYPYISFEIGDDSNDYIFNIFKYMYYNLEQIFSVGFSLNNNFKKSLIVTLKYENRNEKFDEMYNIIENNIKFSKDVEELEIILEIYNIILKNNVNIFLSFGDIKKTGKMGIYVHFNEKDNILLNVIKEMFEFENMVDIKEHNFYQIVYYLDNYNLKDLKKMKSLIFSVLKIS